MLSDEILDYLYQSATRSLQRAPSCGVSDDMIEEGVPFAANILQIIAHMRDKGLVSAGAIMQKGPVKQTVLLVARSEADMTAMLTQLREGVNTIAGAFFSIIGQ